MEIIFDKYTLITPIEDRGRFEEYSGIMVGFETLQPQPLLGQSGFNFCNCRNSKV